MGTQKRKFKIVFRPGRPLTKVVLLITIVLCTAALIVIHNATEAQRQRLDAQKAAAFAQEQERNAIQNKIDRLGSQESIIEIAGDELGLHDPDKIIVETE